MVIGAGEFNIIKKIVLEYNTKNDLALQNKITEHPQSPLYDYVYVCQQDLNTNYHAISSGASRFTGIYGSQY